MTAVKLKNKSKWTNGGWLITIYVYSLLKKTTWMQMQIHNLISSQITKQYPQISFKSCILPIDIILLHHLCFCYSSQLKTKRETVSESSCCATVDSPASSTVSRLSDRARVQTVGEWQLYQGRLGITTGTVINTLCLSVWYKQVLFIPTSVNN